METGIFGSAATTGVYGTAPNYGVYGKVATNYGVFGSAVAQYGVYGTADVGYGVYGTASRYGVYGKASTYGMMASGVVSYGISAGAPDIAGYFIAGIASTCVWFDGGTVRYDIVSIPVTGIANGGALSTPKAFLPLVIDTGAGAQDWAIAIYSLA